MKLTLKAKPNRTPKNTNFESVHTIMELLSIEWKQRLPLCPRVYGVLVRSPVRWVPPLSVGPGVVTPVALP